MEWFWYSIMRAFFISGKKLSLKVSLNHENSNVTISAFYMTVVSAVFLIPFVFFDGSWRSIQDPVFFKAILSNVAFNVVAHILLLNVIRKFEISYVSAIQATSPLIFGLFSFVILSEFPSIEAFLFMIVIACGGVLVEMSHAKHFDFRGFVKNSAWLWLILYLCLAAVATVFSRVAVTTGDPEAYLAFRYLFLSVIFFVFYLIYESNFGAKILKCKRLSVRIRFDKTAILVGIFLMFAVICEMNALALMEMSKVEALTKLSIAGTLIVDAVFISKTIGWKRWVGASLILLGGVGVAFS